MRHLHIEPDNYAFVSRCDAIRGSGKLLARLTAEIDSNMRPPKWWKPRRPPKPPAAPKILQRKFDQMDDEAALSRAHSIQCAVADYFETAQTDIIGSSRVMQHALPRMVGMYLMREKTKFSLSQIGLMFGGRDHTTALYSHRKISAELLLAEQLAFDVAWLIEAITGEQQ